MHRHTRFANWTGLLVLLPVFLCGQARADLPFENAVVFGDSLSDAGNVFVATHEFSRAPYALIPERPYPIGGMTFSNGPTWVQQLLAYDGLRTDGMPAMLGHGVFGNYAFGGARARPSGLFDLTTQVDLFLQDAAYPAGETLYVLAFGGNDVRDAIVAYMTDPSGATSAAIIQQAVASIGDNIQRLRYSAGASRFLVAGAPDLSLVPAVRLQGPQVQFLARQLCLAFNQGLAQLLSLLESGGGVQIARLDLYAVLNDTVAAPPPGLDNVTDACITPDVRGDAICHDPDHYLFWDGLHPTKAGHGILAGVARAVLEVPVVAHAQ